MYVPMNMCTYTSICTYTYVHIYYIHTHTQVPTGYSHVSSAPRRVWANLLVFVLAVPDTHGYSQGTHGQRIGRSNVESHLVVGGSGSTEWYMAPRRALWCVGCLTQRYLRLLNGYSLRPPHPCRFSTASAPARAPCAPCWCWVGLQHSY